MSNNPIVNSLYTSSSDPKKKKNPPPKPINNSYENPFEAFQHLGKGVASTVKDNASAAKSDVFNQLFGGDKLFHNTKPQGGDLTPGQEIDFKKAQDQAAKDQEKSLEKQANTIRPAMDYVGEILRAGETPKEKESQETKQQVQNLILELKNLSASAKSLEKQVLEATGSNVVNAGKYHKTFFQHLLSIIRDAKSKIDSAGTWLSAMKGKQKKGMGMGQKKKKTNYWDMAQQHGTKFTLSGERAVSNQTG